jgi:FkbM family methyltransferase
MTNRLKELQSLFRQNQISKEDYINRMHEIHAILWEYQELIKEENVSSIEITKDEVRLTSGEGVKMLCDPVDERIVPIEILNFGDYESSEIRMIQRFLEKDSVVLDIGANTGWYSLRLSKNVPQGLIIAFEPIPKTFEYLKKNIEINGAKNIRIHDYGLSDKDENIEFYYDPTLSGATSLRNLHENRKNSRIRCIVRRLDGVISEETSRIDLIKCDVEGAEIFVIKGALETLKRTKPVLFLEMLRKWSAKFDYHPNDIIRLLNGIGYECYCIEGEKLSCVKEIDEQTIATNFFFLHPQKHKRFIPK